MKIERLWVLICIAGILAACGQKGPLVLPDAPKHKKAAPALRPNPAPAPAITPAGPADDLTKP